MDLSRPLHKYAAEWSYFLFFLQSKNLETHYVKRIIQCFQLFYVQRSIYTQRLGTRQFYCFVFLFFDFNRTKAHFVYSTLLFSPSRSLYTVHTMDTILPLLIIIYTCTSVPAQYCTISVINIYILSLYLKVLKTII